jgi:hypothetical protein
MLGTGRPVHAVPLAHGPVKGAQVRPAQEKDLEQPEHRQDGDDRDKEFGQCVLRYEGRTPRWTRQCILASGAVGVCHARDCAWIAIDLIAEYDHPALG